MKVHYLRLLAVSAFAPIAACAEGDHGPSGPEVAIEVAPLTLPGTQGVSYALAVYNQDPTPYTNIFDVAGDASKTTGLVWHQQDVTSNQFGNGAGGDISYVGPCDASSSHNWVALALNRVNVGDGNGSYDVTSGGAFSGGSDNLLDDQNSALTANPGSNDLDPDFENPCPYDAPCVLPFPCEENEDTRVVFNLTVMRDAEQGFFDIAVNFEDIFCSAKFDTCYEGSTPIELLFGDDTDTDLTGTDALGDEPGRDWTGVFAMACTAGPGSGVQTQILMSAVQVTCPNATFSLPISNLDPAAGNQKVSVNVDGTGGNEDVEYAIYFGAEDLLCDNEPCNKTYLNVAINLEDLPEDCNLTLQASAQDATDPSPSFTGGTLTTTTGTGTTYPFVHVTAASLNQACTTNRLNDTGSDVVTFYGSTMNGGTMASSMLHSSTAGAAPVTITDTTPPTVASTDPADGSAIADPATVTTVTINFSEAINAASITGQIGLAKRGDIVTNADGTPDAAGAYFTKSGTTFTDLGFVTGRPVLVSNSSNTAALANGVYFASAVQDYKLYLVDSTGAAVNYSSDLTANVAAFAYVSDTLVASGNSVTITPNGGALTGGSYYMGLVGTGVADLAGNTLVAPFVWFFTTN